MTWRSMGLGRGLDAAPATVFRPVVRPVHQRSAAWVTERSNPRGVAWGQGQSGADQFDREIESALHDHQQRMEDVYGLRNQ